MEVYKVYSSPGEFKSFTKLNAARRAFVHESLSGRLTAFVREDGLNFLVTVNNPYADKVITKIFSKRPKVNEFLAEMF
jgi:hypothetical protein